MPGSPFHHANWRSTVKYPNGVLLVSGGGGCPLAPIYFGPRPEVFFSSSLGRRSAKSSDNNVAADPVSITAFTGHPFTTPGTNMSARSLACSKKTEHIDQAIVFCHSLSFADTDFNPTVLVPGKIYKSGCKRPSVFYSTPLKLCSSLIMTTLGVSTPTG